jgi:DNA-binding transcriptional LysR family regulator
MFFLRNIDSLRYFVAVAEHQGIRRAAHALSITQPALTRRIQLLEEEVGSKLMERSEKGVVLTDAGEALLKAATQIELSCKRAQLEIKELTSGRLSELRVGAGPAWSYHIVPRALASLRSMHPELKVHIYAGMVDDMIGQLSSGELDLIVGTLPGEQESSEELSYHFVADVEVQIFCRAHHPLTARDSVNARDMVPYPWVWMSRSGAGRQHVAALFNRAGEILPAATVTTNSFQSGLSMVESGDYLMMLPTTLTGFVSSRNLRPLRLDEQIWRYPAGIICLRQFSGLRTVRDFQSCLAQSLAETAA